MIKSIHKFFDLPIHEFYTINDENYNLTDLSGEFPIIGLVHQDGYFVFGIVIGTDYFYPAPLEDIKANFNGELERKVKGNLVHYILNGKSFDELKREFMGYITYEEYEKLYEKKDKAE